MKIKQNNILFIQSKTGGGWVRQDELMIITTDGKVLTCADAAYAFYDANESIEYLEALDFKQEYQINVTDIQVDKPIQVVGRNSIAMDAPSKIWFRINSDTNSCECIGAYGDFSFQYKQIKTNFDVDIQNIRKQIDEQYQKQSGFVKPASCSNASLEIKGEISAKEAKTITKLLTDGHPCLTSFHASNIDVSKFAKGLLHDCE